MINPPKIGDANWGPNLLAYLAEVDRRIKMLLICSLLQGVAIIVFASAYIIHVVR